MVQKATVVRDIPLSLGCALFLLVLGISGLGDKAGMTLGHADGVIFLIVFAGYIFTMVRSAMKARAAGQKVEIEGVEEMCNMKELSMAKVSLSDSWVQLQLLLAVTLPLIQPAGLQ